MVADELDEILDAIAEMPRPEQKALFVELLSGAELEMLRKRWMIVKMLGEGHSQRKIAEVLHASLCNITRGARALREPQSVLRKVIPTKQPRS